MKGGVELNNENDPRLAASAETKAANAGGQGGLEMHSCQEHLHKMWAPCSGDLHT
jgi:hypothetical protein